MLARRKPQSQLNQPDIFPNIFEDLLHPLLDQLNWDQVSFAIHSSNQR